MSPNYADSKERHLEDSFTHEIVTDYLEDNGAYVFVSVCRDKSKRYFLLVSKGDKSGITFIMDDGRDDPYLPAVLWFGEFESAYVESLGGVYTMHVTKELVDKMVKSATYILMRDVTPEMLYDKIDVEFCKFQIELNLSP